MTPKANPAALERLADEDLMGLVDAKDPNAFEVFYDRHGGAAYSLAHRIVGDPVMAEVRRQLQTMINQMAAERTPV